MNHVELIVVMPVYNEEASIVRVVRDWLHSFAKEGIAHRLIVINDGSRDRTLPLLKRCEEEFSDRLLVIDQPNSGHGRSCRRGYEKALMDGAPWILQIDSDGQCDPMYFPAFWLRRSGADCVFGVREVRDDGLVRKWISIACRLLTALVTGTNLRDANVPYRLMKREALEVALRNVPPDFDLQNIALTLALKRQRKVRWEHLPIRFRARQGGTNSINLFKITAMGWELLTQIHRIGAKG